MSRVASFHLATFPTRRMVTKLISVPAERWELNQTSGCVLGKVLGTSKADTTRISFELRRWAIFAVWESDEARQVFFDDSTVLRRWRSSATSLQHYSLRPTQSRGTWSGTDPFAGINPTVRPSGDIAVLTRAAVRGERWWRFARSAGGVDDALQQQTGCKLAVGVGEWPIGEQATFSVWKSPEAIDAFAYRSDAHRAVVKRTFDENWYSEMLFTRFAIESLTTEIG